MKKPASASKRPSVPQEHKFRELARQLECDDSEAAFEAKVKAVAKPKPKATKPG